jgi:hypothetical protein
LVRLQIRVVFLKFLDNVYDERMPDVFDDKLLLILSVPNIEFLELSEQEAPVVLSGGQNRLVLEIG